MDLTKPQKLIYHMEKFAGKSIANICASMFINGEKNEPEMQAAVNELFRLNDALRIRITEAGTDVSQYVAEFSEQKIDVLYFEDRISFDTYANDFAKAALNLSGPLCDIKIIIFPQRYGLLVKMHHIISDAWTVALLATQFNSLINGETPKSYSYFEYCETEKEYFSSKRFLKDKEFFLAQFRKCGELTFISDKCTKSLEAKRRTFVITSQDANTIRSFAQHTNCSVFTVFATALATYINRTKGNSERFFIGTTVLNRLSDKDLNTAGMFINTVPILLEVNNSKTFLENLEKTEDTLMSVFRHQKYNYGDLLTDIRRENASCNKLYDVMLSYMNASVGGTNEATDSTWYHNGIQNESLQINFDDRDNEGIFKVQYDYQTEKFTEQEIEALHIHLMNLLLGGIQKKNEKLYALDMLTSDERQKLLVDFNSTAVEHAIPPQSTVYSLFEQTAREHSSKICITCADKTLTFGELSSLAETLDKEIRRITGSKKSVVAVLAERSIEMYSAIYGILRGGNAYLPLSPDDPKERIEYVLKNSSAALVVAQDKFSHLAGTLPCIRMTSFIENPPIIKAELPCAAEADDTAYVIYTSGSTGTPKGAKISHKAAVNRILWMHETYPLGTDGVILQKTPYTFDVSVWEIFWWGMCGGSLAASKPGEHFLPVRILNEVYECKVTHLHFVPSVFDLFITYLEAHKEDLFKFNSVKHVFLSGEVLNSALIQRFYALYDYSSVKLHNLYGPTECAVDVTYYDCTPEETSPVPIGRPIHNVGVYITDKYLNILPIGVKGELLISGANVGQGYLNNKELTAEQFIHNPFGDGKLYKTGDLAYWREDGQIIFCGRMDGQVKLNGQRVETGEIEAVIESIPGVEAVAVIMRKANGQDTLVAFYCSQENHGETIKRVCTAKLPKHMVPGVICQIKKMPLNQNGKINRNDLASWLLDTAVAEIVEAPINKTEKRICEVFSRVLRRSEIGRNSDFFVLGGSSLAMISVLSEAGFGRITPADFISNPTPAKLAQLLEGKCTRELKYLEVLLESERPEKAIVLVPFAGGGVEAYTNLINSIKAASSNISLYFVRFLHTDDECEQAAKEISQVLGESNIYFYSHCAGSATAMQVLRFLERNQSGSVQHYIAGASIPPRKAGKRNPWNLVPNKILKQILIKAGATFKTLPDEKVAQILKHFRHDTDFAAQVFALRSEKIGCPVSVVISKNDIFTLNYKQAEKAWKKYAQTVKSVHFINSSTHYFQSEDSDALAQIVLSIDS